MSATNTSPATPTATADEAQRGFSRSIVVSGIRCVLTYVILPFVAPFLGFAPGTGPIIGLVVGTVALIANVFSIRRFWSADHRWKKPVTALHLAVIVLLLVLMYLDITALVG
ncbi:MAG: hypothetical protein ACR2QO_27885 [Acidimicrobiales bacterium]